jgi:hypothetical protein
MEQKSGLLNMAFLSHTDQDNLEHESSSLASFIQHILKEKGRSSFFDTLSIKSGEFCESKIESAVKDWQVFVALLSVSYFIRYWPMRELDIALNEPKAQGREFLFILLGVDRGCLESVPKNWVEEWARMANDPRRKSHVNLGRWKNNLRKTAT